MLRLKKDEHKLSWSCTKSGIQFARIIILQSNAFYPFQLETFDSRWRCMKQSHRLGKDKTSRWTRRKPCFSEQLQGHMHRKLVSWRKRCQWPLLPNFAKGPALQIPGANFYFFLPTWVLGNLKSTTLLSISTGLGQHDISMKPLLSEGK